MAVDDAQSTDADAYVWGTVADLVHVLDVQPDGPLRYAAPAWDDEKRPVVEGSQILAQAIVAAGREAPGKRTASASMVFARAVDARAPYVLELDQVSGGRTFSVFGVRAVQGERTCAIGTVLADVTAPDVIRHAEAPPDVAGPDGSAPIDMGVPGRDIRVVDDAYTNDPDAPTGPPELDVWVRFGDLPDDPAMHVALLAQFTGHMSIAAALRPHAGIGQAQAHVSLSTAVNAISLSVHREVRADQWLLYHHRSTAAADGMTHSECRVFEQDGPLVASFTNDCMVRAFSAPPGADATTAM